MKFSIALIASISATLVAAIPSAGLEAKAAHRARAHAEPRGYAQDADLLEPYDTYHTRYLDFGCKHEHGTSFFDQCCHPKLKTEDPNSFPDLCYANVSCDDDNGGDDGNDGGAVTSSVVANYQPATSAAAPSPKPTSYPPKPSATSAAPPPASTSSSGGGGDGGNWNYGGQATYFYQNGNAGACGQVHSDYDLIGAIDQNRWGGDFGVVSQNCGKSATLCRMDNDSTCVTITFADVCPTCTGGSLSDSDATNSIDLSVGAFQKLGSLGEGTINIKWKFD